MFFWYCWPHFYFALQSHRHKKVISVFRFFMTSYLLTDNGLITLNRVMSGFRMQNPILFLIQLTDTGYFRIMAGPGLPISNGAGLLSIMDAGAIITHLDGFGCLIMNGGLPGLTGGKPMAITAGHQWNPE